MTDQCRIVGRHERPRGHEREEPPLLLHSSLEAARHPGGGDPSATMAFRRRVNGEREVVGLLVVFQCWEFHAGNGAAEELCRHALASRRLSRRAATMAMRPLAPPTRTRSIALAPCGMVGIRQPSGGSEGGFQHRRRCTWRCRHRPSSGAEVTRRSKHHSIIDARESVERPARWILIVSSGCSRRRVVKRLGAASRFPAARGVRLWSRRRTLPSTHSRSG